MNVSAAIAETEVRI